jgi:DNA-binding MarR family transcriptional regulator
MLVKHESYRAPERGYTDIRPGHGCVFGNIDPDGSRLTDLAGRAGMTKQSVGEVTSDLEQRGYLERVPDPADRRAKIIRLTDRGREAHAIGRGLIEDIERDWADRFGTEDVAALRVALEVITAERLGAVPVQRTQAGPESGQPTRLADQFQTSPPARFSITHTRDSFRFG